MAKQSQRLFLLFAFLAGLVFALCAGNAPGAHDQAQEHIVPVVVAIAGDAEAPVVVQPIHAIYQPLPQQHSQEQAPQQQPAMNEEMDEEMPAPIAGFQHFEALVGPLHEAEEGAPFDPEHNDPAEDFSESDDEAGALPVVFFGAYDEGGSFEDDNMPDEPPVLFRQAAIVPIYQPSQ